MKNLEEYADYMDLKAKISTLEAMKNYLIAISIIRSANGTCSTCSVEKVNSCEERLIKRLYILAKAVRESLKDPTYIDEVTEEKVNFMLGKLKLKQRNLELGLSGYIV
jgi:hypothetical protein